ncbi:MAG: HAD-IC family P-type ATPase [Bacilli bacterium]|nr:HAD-IC family P-type ATPase [Bacilli bacterium]
MAKKDNFVDQNSAIRFHPDIHTGLTKEEITQRNEQGLNNKVDKGSNKTILSIILKNIFTFFNIMYIIIFFLLLSADADLFNYSFVVIVTANTAIGIFQEIKSKRTIDKLSLLSAPRAFVVRDGIKQEVDVADIVLDDIMYLNAGKEITTDAILVEGEIEVNESQLTGESVPIRKNIGDTLYSGSYVVSGNCYAQVERVGKENAIEKLSNQAKQYSKPRSEILTSLRYLLRFVSIIIIPSGLILYIRAEKITSFMDFLKSPQSPTYSDSIMSTSAALLGMIPAGLFLLTTVALAVGVMRLAKRKTLVQEIYCIEMLARVDVLCLDKTGTITDGTMTVTRYIEPRRNSEYNVADIMSSLNTALQESNSTAKALENYFGFGKKYTPQEILPFSSENKYSAVSFKEYPGTFVLGAPEFVLKASYDRISDTVNEYANQGLRVLALAHSPLTLKDGKIQRTPKLVALILIEDQIRREAYDTIKYFKENGVQVKVISGDNPVTVSEVSRRVGIENAEDYISLEGLTDEEVAQVANSYTVFGRVKPNQKQILVKALKEAKHTVAMTGDGVNDILALKEADCSIAMASGCDAVRNVAQLVLLDSNFASMPHVVGEGRRVINNIQRTASLFFVKTLFSMIIAILVIAGFFTKFSPSLEGNYPFIASQLMPIEMFAIGIPAFFLALQPNRDIIKGRFLYNIIRKSLPGAITIAIQVCLAYVFARPLGFTTDQVATIVVISATATCMLILYSTCRPFKPFTLTLFIAMVSLTLFCTFGSIKELSIGPINLRDQFQLVEITNRETNAGSIQLKTLLEEYVEDGETKTRRVSKWFVGNLDTGLYATNENPSEKENENYIIDHTQVSEYVAEHSHLEYNKSDGKYYWVIEERTDYYNGGMIEADVKINASPLLLLLAMTLSSYLIIIIVNAIIAIFMGDISSLKKEKKIVEEKEEPREEPREISFPF